LESETYNNLSVNYSLIKNNFNLDFNVSWSLVNKGLVPVQWLDNDIKYSTYANVGKGGRTTVSLYFQWTINSKTRWMANINGGYTYCEQPSPVGADGTVAVLSRGRWWMSPWMRFSRDLPWKLEASVSGNWWSGILSDVYGYMKPSAKNIVYSFALARKFLKDDRLTIRIHANNIFGPAGSDSHNITLNPAYRTDSHYRNENRRYVGLSASFRFGSLNAEVKKTAASINNDDLQGRKK